MNGKFVPAGLIGGLVAGAVMAMVAMMYTLVAQGDLLAPLKQMGALFFPNDSGTPLSMLAGMMLHMMTSAVFGIAFALAVAQRITGVARLATFGVIFIVIEWAIASFLILPVIDRALLATFATIGGFAAHLSYGIVLGWWLAWRAAPSRVAVVSARRTATQSHATH